jgi:hypothetical protein
MSLLLRNRPMIASEQPWWWKYPVTYFISSDLQVFFRNVEIHENTITWECQRFYRNIFIGYNIGTNVTEFQSSITVQRVDTSLPIQINWEDNYLKQFHWVYSLNQLLPSTKSGIWTKEDNTTGIAAISILRANYDNQWLKFKATLYEPTNIVTI